MTAKPRRTLGTWGRRGDRVRVLVDGTRDRVEVLYRDTQGIDRKRIFGNDKAGRAEIGRASCRERVSSPV